MRQPVLLAAALIALPAAAAPTIEGCPLLPADHVWNARVDGLPVHPRSDAWVRNMAPDGDGDLRIFRFDFGAGLFPPPPDPRAAPLGIPHVVVPGTQPRVPVSFDPEVGSDAGPFPIPPGAPIEGVGPPNAEGSRRVIVLDRDACALYEMFHAFPQNGGASWTAYSGVSFNLRSNALRSEGFPSADGAGLPILPGLARFDEVAAGAIEHALRITAGATSRSYLWPARNFESGSFDPDVPPMGTRFRLKAAVDISTFSPQAKVIAQAMKTYGVVVADNGLPWHLSGSPDNRWNNADLEDLERLEGTHFEAVDVELLRLDYNSGRICGPGDTDGDSIPDCVESREGRNYAVRDNDVFGVDRLFAMQQYRDFLGREGDAGGIAFWAAQLNSGQQSRVGMVEAFFNSPEFQGAGAPVVRLYFAYFLRIPDYGGLDYWMRQYRGGASLEAISSAFAASPEFAARYGSLDNGQFVDLVYRNALGRAPDPGGLAFWKGRLDSGAMTRGGVMLAFSESPEHTGLVANEVFVTMMYVGMLRRSPDAGGFGFWVGYMDAGNSTAALIAGFLSSSEYRARFLPPG